MTKRSQSMMEAWHELHEAYVALWRELLDTAPGRALRRAVDWLDRHLPARTG